ncbi:class F sortase [Salininema proteolyticum]|uniref:Class F sortase n=1 Tax=Salininema proteolyticum TaxID=1607685 RepID=A0ABV8U229_9ACTN
MGVKRVGGRRGGGSRAGALIVAVSLVAMGLFAVVRNVDLSGPEWGIDRPRDQAMSQEELEEHVAKGKDLTLPPSTPKRIAIDSIGVDAEVGRVGLDRHGNIGAPPLFRSNQTAWFNKSSYPGAEGISVVVGHVDSERRGPAVFYDLRHLDVGDTVSVDRRDGTEASFTVTEIASYPKESFPYEEVFEPGPGSEIRLITCGGAFDYDADSYVENTVVYGVLTGAELRSGALSAGVTAW